MNYFKLQKGYVLLMSVLVVSAVAFSVATSVLLFGVDETQVIFSQENGTKALYLAHGCAESALEKIKDSSSYTGTTTILNFGDGQCEYNVINTGGNTRDIHILAEVASTTKKVKLELTGVSPIAITSWQEVASF